MIFRARDGSFCFHLCLALLASMSDFGFALWSVWYTLEINHGATSSLNPSDPGQCLTQGGAEGSGQATHASSGAYRQHRNDESDQEESAAGNSPRTESELTRFGISKPSLQNHNIVSPIDCL
jgi:hypothetical protein